MSWVEAEREFDDEVVGTNTLGEMFDATARRHSDQPAQMYKGGVYARSLTNTDVVDAAPDGEYATLSYAGMHDLVKHLAAGFRALGLEAGQRVGLFADTRME